MKLRVLICLFLITVVISDVTIVAATHYEVNVVFESVSTEVPHMGTPEYFQFININGTRIITAGAPMDMHNFIINYNINTITMGGVDGYFYIWDGLEHWWYFRVDVINANFTIYHRGRLVASGSGLGTHTLNLPCPSVYEIIPFHRALNFTLAGAMTLPVMTIDLVDDIMLTVGKYINCGLAKFTIRAALLKFAAKGVAVVTAITAIGYLFYEFADDIYYAIFATIPEINPGDTHFQEVNIPCIMNVIDTHYPVFPHIRNAIEQAIRLHIDAHGLISIADVMQIIRNHQKDVVIDIYKETPEILPDNIPVHRDQVPEIMDMVDEYFPIEIPIRNIIEQEIHRYINEDVHHEIPIEEVYEYIEKYQNINIGELPPAFPPFVNEENLPEVIELIDEYFPVEIPIRDIIEEEIKDQIIHDYPNEIPFEEVIEIIEREQNIYVPEIPVETPEQHREYINNIIDRVIYKDPYIPIIETPFIYPGIPATPTIPRTPERPKEKIHTFPFYSIFVDPLAAVIGITLAHLFAAMMIIGAIISIGAAWGSIGAILAGFIGTITTSYFGLTSWLIPLYLIVVFIIYMNIRIRNGGGRE